MDNFKIEITHIKHGHGGYSYFEINGITKNKLNEKLFTFLIVKLFRDELYGKNTLNTWHNSTLEIRYAETEEEYYNLIRAIESDKALPKKDTSRSLLYR